MKAVYQIWKNNPRKEKATKLFPVSTLQEALDTIRRLREAYNTKNYYFREI